MTTVFNPSQTPIQSAWITLAGPDAPDFLHRLTTVNVRDLGVGHGASGFFLNAQGRIRAHFHLWRYGEQEFGFELDAGADGKWKRELLTTIDQFTFAEKFAVTDVTAMETRWIFPDSPDSAGLKPGETRAIDDEIRLCNHGSLDFGRTWISAWGRPARLQQWIEQTFPKAEALRFEELETWRVLSLRPRVDSEISASVLPLEIGLADGIAENKGCYPGQEVIEKIISLGAAPRRLARIDGEGSAPAPGQKIYNVAETPSEVGQITSVVQCEGKFSALGIIRKIHAKEGLPVQFDASTQTKAQATIVRVAP